MTKVFVYEYCTAVGAGSDSSDPATWPLGRQPPGLFPLVAKPRFGAGSMFTSLVRNDDELVAVQRSWEPGVGDMIVQEYAPGRPASVAFLVGPSQAVPLQPTFQNIASDDRFRYEGCELPIPADLADRAVSLGRRAVACVPGLRGYVGVDLLLGDAADGSRDYAIEINPRASMSYIALRALADFNLAEVMLTAAEGRQIPAPRWKPGRVRMGPDWAAVLEPDGRAAG